MRVDPDEIVRAPEHGVVLESGQKGGMEKLG